MKILLVRHGESTGNRDHLWAGITDHELTAHGFLQAQRLAEHLSTKLKLSKQELQIYCSDLTRARRTAQAVADKLTAGDLTVSKLLREQDLGWREGLSFRTGDRKDPSNKIKLANDPGETKDMMDIRASQFITDLGSFEAKQDRVLVVVSHGLFLLRLYARLCASLAIEHQPPAMWSNTGVLTIQITEDKASVLSINAQEHLQGLKRTRLVGSAAYDVRQQKVSHFFTQSPVKKRHKAEHTSDAGLQQAVDANDATCAAQSKASSSSFPGE